MMNGFLWTVLLGVGLFVLGVEIGRRNPEDPYGVMADKAKKGYAKLRKPVDTPTVTLEGPRVITHATVSGSAG